MNNIKQNVYATVCVNILSFFFYTNTLNFKRIRTKIRLLPDCRQYFMFRLLLAGNFSSLNIFSSFDSIIYTMAEKKSFWLNGIHSLTKVAFSILIGMATVLLLRLPETETLIRYILGYCAFGSTLLAFHWVSFYRTPIHHIQAEAQKEDSSRPVISFLILLSVLGSLLAIILIIASKNANPQTKLLHIGSAMAGVSIGWFLLHSVYTVKYAHHYYGNSKQDKGSGLVFPEAEGYMPDFMDFVYFSFTLGMCFQTSDVNITNKKMRRIALWHSLISFIFNAVIIAVTINLIAGIGS